MNTTFTLVQAAVILSISYSEARRLARRRKLRASKRPDNVFIVKVEDIQAYIQAVTS